MPILTNKLAKIQQKIPTAASVKGRNAPIKFKDKEPKVIAAIIEPAYDSNKSAPMPATSPTLSPTLSEITAGFLGSSSGIFSSTFPTKSAPISAALVNIPPPTLANNATVTMAHSKTQNLQEITKKADILIAAIGKAKFVNRDFIKDGATVIDVGINRCEDKKLYGDVDFESVKDMNINITPVPGGVGPMTITMLLHNTILAFERHNNL